MVVSAVVVAREEVKSNVYVCVWGRGVERAESDMGERCLWHRKEV